MLLNAEAHLTGTRWGSLKVLVVLMETVEVVRVPRSNREMMKIKNLHPVLANMINSVHSAAGCTLTF